MYEKYRALVAEFVKKNLKNFFKKSYINKCLHYFQQVPIPKLPKDPGSRDREFQQTQSVR